VFANMLIVSDNTISDSQQEPTAKSP